MTTTTVQIAPDRKKLLRRAATIHRQFLKEVEELNEENSNLAKGGWARAPYCKHGTFIGDPYGGDYLCWACEDGISDLEYALGIAHSQCERDRRRYLAARSMLAALEEHAATPGLTPSLAQTLAEQIEIEAAEVREFTEKWL